MDQLELITRIEELGHEIAAFPPGSVVTKTATAKTATHSFSTLTRISSKLKSLSEPVKKYKKRECYAKLHDYVFGEHQDRVFILYGLRRTGKTTLIRQVLLDMTPKQLEQTAFIQIKAKDTLSEINTNLKYLETQGFKYVFIDEVTLMEDFIEGAALFSDIYASSGMKIVLSGADSLGFIFTKDEQLYSSYNSFTISYKNISYLAKTSPNLHHCKLGDI